MVAHYQVKEELGRGAMGVVYRAYDPKLKRDVAIKVLKERPDATALGRFVQEGQVAARVRHANVLSVHDLVVPEQGSPYLVTDFAPGGSLRDRIKRSGLLEPEEIQTLLLAILGGVGALHEIGVVHRDLKPENILFDADGVPLVADLGLARALDRETRYTQSGVLTGTPAYMAPEQLDGRSLGPATDVYALGVILYELLTGRLPFRANTLIEQIRMLLEVKPPTPSSFVATVDPGLAAICLRCLEKDPAARYADAGALGQDLASWRRGGASPRRSWLWAGALASLALLGGALAFASQRDVSGATPTPTPTAKSAASQPQAPPAQEGIVIDRESFAARAPRRVLVNRPWALGVEREGLRFRINRESGPELYLPLRLVGGRLSVRARVRVDHLTKGAALYLRILPGGPSGERARGGGLTGRDAVFEAAIQERRARWGRTGMQRLATPIQVPVSGPYELELRLEFRPGSASGPPQGAWLRRPPPAGAGPERRGARAPELPRAGRRLGGLGSGGAGLPGGRPERRAPGGPGRAAAARQRGAPK